MLEALRELKSLGLPATHHFILLREQGFQLLVLRKKNTSRSSLFSQVVALAEPAMWYMVFMTGRLVHMFTVINLILPLISWDKWSIIHTVGRSTEKDGCDWLLQTHCLSPLGYWRKEIRPIGNQVCSIVQLSVF